MVALSVAIMAHPSRQAFVDEVSKSLDRDVPIVWDRCNDIWDTGRRALLHHDADSDFHLVLQDDTIVCRDFVASVERALESIPADAAASFYLGAHQNAAAPLALVHEMWDGHPYSWMRARDMLWGPACVIPTARVADCVKLGDDRNVRSYDQRILTWTRRRQVDVYYSHPSLVDHRISPSLRGGRLHRQAREFVGAEASGLDLDWSGPVADTRYSPQGGTIMARFRNQSTGQEVTLTPSDPAFVRINRMATNGYRWDRIEDGPVEPEPAAPAGIAADVDMSAKIPSILEAVGSDAAKAQAVMEAEASADKPRSTLLETLAGIVAGAESDRSEE